LGDGSVLLRFAIGGVLLIAGAGKLVGQIAFPEFVLVAVELVVAVVLLSGLYALAATIAATVLAIGYFLYALRPRSEPCHCFGARLPTTSPWGQRYRNSALLTSCGVQIAILTVMGRGSPAGNLALDVALGAVAATSIIVLPWFVDWASAST
jgi:hypothetical protein